MAKLPRDFFLGDTVEIARNLLGTYLVRQLPGQTLAVRITETEAYVGRCDKACHAYQYRRTDRTKTMFGPPGYAYIYLIYGMYHCLNLVTEPEGEPSAVLIRGAEPILGTKMIRWLRYGEKPLTPVREKNLLNGPGKLCKGISLDRTFDGQDLCSDILYLCDSPADFGVPSIPLQHEQLRAGPRIGIDYAEEARFFPWRFWLEKEE